MSFCPLSSVDLCSGDISSGGFLIMGHGPVLSPAHRATSATVAPLSHVTAGTFKASQL